MPLLDERAQRVFGRPARLVAPARPPPRGDLGRQVRVVLRDVVEVVGDRPGDEPRRIGMQRIQQRLEGKTERASRQY